MTPFGDGRVIGRDVEHEQDVDDDHQDVGADDRAGRPAAAAAERGAADHDGGEHLQQHGIADQRIARARLGADEDAGEAVEAAGQDIDEESHPRDPDAWRASRLDIAADRVERRPEPGALEPQPQAAEDATAARSASAGDSGCIADETPMKGQPGSCRPACP